MGEPDPTTTAAPRKYSAAISYRRKDGTAYASRLLRGLMNFRIPRRFVVEPLRPIYLDRLNETADHDFFEDVLKPALRDSDYLIVVITPSVREPAPDGGPGHAGNDAAVAVGLHSHAKQSNLLADHVFFQRRAGSLAVVAVICDFDAGKPDLTAVAERHGPAIDDRQNGRRTKDFRSALGPVVSPRRAREPRRKRADDSHAGTQRRSPPNPKQTAGPWQRYGRSVATLRAWSSVRRAGRKSAHIVDIRPVGTRPKLIAVRSRRATDCSWSASRLREPLRLA